MYFSVSGMEVVWQTNNYDYGGMNVLFSQWNGSGMADQYDYGEVNVLFSQWKWYGRPIFMIMEE